MMRILDRYILRQYLTNFVLLVLMLLALIILVDFIVDVDEFIEAARWRAGQWKGSFWLGLVYTLWNYYGPLVCLLFVFICGLAATGALGFTCISLARHGELTAMLTAGWSLYRVAAPLLVVGSALCFLSIPVQEFLVPKLIWKLVRSKSEMRLEMAPALSVYYVPDSQGRLFSAAHLIVPEGRALGISILLPDSTGRLSRRITATEATWEEVSGGWRLKDGRLEEQTIALEAGPQPAPHRVDFFPTELSPHLLAGRRDPVYLRLLSVRELMLMLNNPAADRPTIIRIVHGRFSSLAVNILLIVLAMPFFLTREPANFLVRSLQATALVLGVWAGSVLIIQAGLPAKNPATMAWLPVIVLLPLAAWMVQRIKT